MQLSEREKVCCAVYMLKRDARIWWDVIRQTRDTTQMTWTEFQAIFNEKYYNTAVLATKVNEFSKLQQGNLSVAEYVRKFDQLARFASDMFSNDVTRFTRFIEGLKSELARDVDMGLTRPISYRQAVEKALRAEHREEKILKARASTSFPRRDFQPNANRFNDNKRRGQFFQGG